MSENHHETSFFAINLLPSLKTKASDPWGLVQCLHQPCNTLLFCSPYAGNRKRSRFKRKAWLRYRLSFIDLFQEFSSFEVSAPPRHLSSQLLLTHDGTSYGKREMTNGGTRSWSQIANKIESDLSTEMSARACRFDI